MKKPFELTPENTFPVIKKAIEERTLARYHGKNCKYVYKGDPTLSCAIGVCLPVELREEIKDAGENSSRVTELLANKYIKASADLISDLAEIQLSHDDYIDNERFANIVNNLAAKWGQ